MKPRKLLNDHAMFLDLEYKLRDHCFVLVFWHQLGYNLYIQLTEQPRLRLVNRIYAQLRRCIGQELEDEI